jgi:hypothetical protein
MSATAPTIPGGNAPEKAPKEKKAKKEPTVRRSKFDMLYPGRSKITVLVDKNPKKEGSKAHERFKLYGKNTTVAEFIKKGGTYQDIAYNIGREFIGIEKVADPVVQPAAPSTPDPK